VSDPVVGAAALPHLNGTAATRPSISAHDGMIGVCEVIVAKERLFIVLDDLFGISPPPRAMPDHWPRREEYHGWYGRILDVESTGELRALYRELRQAFKEAAR
jgi:hypothetical protein